MVAVVAHTENLALFYYYVEVGRIHRFVNIRLLKRLAVEVDDVVFYFQMVAAHGNDALDKRRRIAVFIGESPVNGSEYNNVAALYFCEFVEI